MAQIDYTAIELALQDLLLNDLRTKEIDGRITTVVVEEIFQPIPDRCPWIGIYLNGWQSPAESELIGGSAPRLTLVEIELWMYDYSLENATGARKRDLLLQQVKEVLKDNRTINGLVLVTRFTGGEFDGAKTKEGFLKGVSLKLECEIRE